MSVTYDDVCDLWWCLWFMVMSVTYEDAFDLNDAFDLLTVMPVTYADVCDLRRCLWLTMMSDLWWCLWLMMMPLTDVDAYFLRCQRWLSMMPVTYNDACDCCSCPVVVQLHSWSQSLTKGSERTLSVERPTPCSSSLRPTSASSLVICLSPSSLDWVESRLSLYNWTGSKIIDSPPNVLLVCMYILLLATTWPNIPVSVFTVQRYALHGLCDRNSVCLSVRLSVRLSVCLSHSWTVSTWFDLRSWFLHHMVAPSF